MASFSTGSLFREGIFISEGDNIRTAVLTFTYPGIEQYFTDCVKSLEDQTDRDFAFLVINDGANIEPLLTGSWLSSWNILPVNGTIAQNRKAGLQYAKDLGFDSVILIDADDYCHKKRVWQSKALLKDYDVAFNELLLVGEGYRKPTPMFGNRLKNGQTISDSFLIDKNCLGMSNTAINLSVLDGVLEKIPDTVSVFDWDFFSFVLAKDAKAVYTNKTHTFYRQYGKNFGCFNPVSAKQALFGAEVKQLHYQTMANGIKNSGIYTKLKWDYELMRVKLSANYILPEKYAEEVRKLDVRNPLWWEKVILLEDL